MNQQGTKPCLGYTAQQIRSDSVRYNFRQSLRDTSSSKLVAHFQCFSMVLGTDHDNLPSVVINCLLPDIKLLQYLFHQDYCLLASILLWTLFFSILADIISSPYRPLSVYSENCCSDQVDTENLFIGCRILRLALSLASGRSERDTVEICSLRNNIMMTVGDVFFNPIKTSQKHRSSVQGELSHGPLGFQFCLDGLQAPEFSNENNVHGVHKIKYIYR